MFHSWVEVRAEFVKKHFLFEANNHNFGANNHSIIGYPEGPTGSIKHQLPALHRTPQESQHLPEHIVQTVLKY